jgi:hypothetical protein
VAAVSDNAMTPGVTYNRAASTDDTNHTFISPELGQPFEVLRTLLHESVHVSDDCACGHRGIFAARAKALGMTGPMTHSTAGPVLTAELCTLAGVLGEYPHAPMQVTRLIGRRPALAPPSQQTPAGRPGRVRGRRPPATSRSSTWSVGRPPAPPASGSTPG